MLIIAFRERKAPETYSRYYFPTGSYYWERDRLSKPPSIRAETMSGEPSRGS